MTSTLDVSSAWHTLSTISYWAGLDWRVILPVVRILGILGRTYQASIISNIPNRTTSSAGQLQTRIVKATQQGRWGKVKALQRLLTHSFGGKALAVKRVSENTGQRAAGVDGERWSTPHKKMAAVHSLKQKGYQFYHQLVDNNLSLETLDTNKSLTPDCSGRKKVLHWGKFKSDKRLI